MNDVVLEPIDQEEIEALMEKQYRVVTSLGFITMEAYEDFKYHAVEGMLRFGGSFTQSLGQTLRFADMPNSIKLMKLFFSECEQHAMLHKEFIAKRDAGVFDKPQPSIPRSFEAMGEKG